MNMSFYLLKTSIGCKTEKDHYIVKKTVDPNNKTSANFTLKNTMNETVEYYFHDGKV